jgi:ABC-2 type transport system ATP-binding protein
VCIVDQGRIIAIDSPKNLIKQLTREREIQLVFADGPAAAETMKRQAEQYPHVTKAELRDGGLVLWSTQPEESLYHLFQYTTEHRVAVEQISIKDMSLEDVFIAYTGKEWRD